MAVQFPVEPMVVRSIAELPRDGRSWFEPKLDGWRCLAHRDHRARLQSRQLRSLTRMFPAVADAVAEQLPPGTVVDGELVAMRDGRVDFSALHGGARSCCLVAFDLLAVGGVDLRGRPYRERRARLEDLLTAAHGGLALVPAVDDPVRALAWLEHGDRGIEGVVAKRADHGYRPGRRWWGKRKVRTTVDAIVGGVLGPPSAPTALILGRHDARGRLRVVGRTHPLPRQLSAEIGRLVSRPRGPHPWPVVLPGGGFGLAGEGDVVHTPVDPRLVVELEVDTAVEYGRWRHGARLLRPRPDLEPDDVPLAPTSGPGRDPDR